MEKQGKRRRENVVGFVGFKKLPDGQCAAFNFRPFRAQAAG